MDSTTELQRPQEAPSPWREKEAKIFDGLDKKVGIVTSFKREVDTVTIEDSPGSVQEKLNNFYDTMISSYPESTLIRLRKYSELESSFNEALKLTANSTFDEEEEVDLSAISREIEIMEQDPDIVFLLTMRQIKDALIAKNQQVHRMRNNPRILQYELAKLGENRGLSLEKTKETRYSPFSVTFIVDRNDLHETNDYAGWHFVSTPFNFVVDRGEMTERTILHEEIHNFLDGGEALQSVDPNEETKSKFRRYALSWKIPLYGAISKSNVMRLQATTLVNNLQNEMLAHAQIAEMNDFQINYQDEREELLMKEVIQTAFGENDFYRYIGIFSTAGNRMDQLYHYLQIQADVAEDPEVRELADSLARKTGELFVGAVASMENGLATAVRIGEDAHFATHALFYVLRPTQYHHVGRFLRYKYGDAAVEAVQQSKSIGESLSFYPPELEVFLDMLERRKNTVRPIDIERIDKQLATFRVWDHDNLTIDLEAREAYQAILQKLGDATGIEMNEYIPKILKGLTEANLFDAIQQDVHNDFVNLQDLYKGLSRGDQVVFEDMLCAYIADYITDDLKHHQGKTFTLVKVRTMPHWNVVKQLGMEESVEKAIQESQEREKKTRQAFEKTLLDS